MIKSTSIDWTMHTVSSRVNVRSAVIWSSEAPLEVLLAFDVGLRDPVEWTFARDILLDAIQKNRAGEADVQCECENETLVLKIQSPYGTARFTTDASTVGQYLAEIYAIVPRGEETYDMDTLIHKLLEEA